MVQLKTRYSVFGNRHSQQQLGQYYLHRILLQSSYRPLLPNHKYHTRNIYLLESLMKNLSKPLPLLIHLYLISIFSIFSIRYEFFIIYIIFYGFSQFLLRQYAFRN
uniref:Uncharacterized protein ORF-c22_017 n=1 Tax=Saccharolobus solfataricus TaxID=2287 RepID=Q9UWT9_SACSO|nr:hypothetical protein [Saccharolobus solfataricus P2]